MPKAKAPSVRPAHRPPKRKKPAPEHCLCGCDAPYNARTSARHLANKGPAVVRAQHLTTQQAAAPSSPETNRTVPQSPLPSAVQDSAHVDFAHPDETFETVEDDDQWDTEPEDYDSTWDKDAIHDDAYLTAMDQLGVEFEANIARLRESQSHTFLFVSLTTYHRISRPLF
jgi:hypothetical protein